MIERQSRDFILLFTSLLFAWKIGQLTMSRSYQSNDIHDEILLERQSKELAFEEFRCYEPFRSLSKLSGRYIVNDPRGAIQWPR